MRGVASSGVVLPMVLLVLVLLSGVAASMFRSATMQLALAAAQREAQIAAWSIPHRTAAP
ncbi:PilX-like prepilin protein [Luteibacter rhizovicinus]|uniref:PilX-like prepilin protein n=1 Tax=Luteibacter rhizovicinus TaxID=242606 RepID=A0A4R3YWL9_9GAMM|nr:PilX N-terminal domain-containing pilus assembly protein [Luteibacter rhizovicinus]TCV97517.1 PilX-like prepilin protein [Luteibacter rhizovicinus]